MHKRKIKNMSFIMISIMLVLGILVSLVFSFSSFKASSFFSFKLVQDVQKDSDHDGIVDSLDKNPNQWDVSDRDLRFFQELAYRPETEIRDMFNNYKPVIDWYNKSKLLSKADIREITSYWKFVEQVNGPHGFSASVFSNGKVGVLAIRGTNGDSADLLDDFYLTVGSKPYQAFEVVKMKSIMDTFDKYYVTGHSLGGYLAQYYAGEVGYYDSKFVRATVFNAPGVSLRRHRWVENNVKELVNTTYTDDSVINNPVQRRKIQSYRIKGDIVSKVYEVKDNVTLVKRHGSIDRHTSTGFFSYEENDAFNTYFSNGIRKDK